MAYEKETDYGSCAADIIMETIQYNSQLPFNLNVIAERRSMERVRDLLIDLDDPVLGRTVYLLRQLPESDRSEVLEFVEKYFSSEQKPIET